MTKMYDVLAISLEDNKKDTHYYSGDCELSYITTAMENEGYEIDLKGTMEKYVNFKVVQNFIDEMENISEVMETPLEELFGEGKIYDILNEYFPLEESQFDLSTISQMETISSGQSDDLIFDNGLQRVWVSRVDDDLVTFERMYMNEYGSVSWEEIETFYAE
ncbi:hypothetical protein [Bacillus thuringiensis]|uniref:hypothetical protein n=1 Tax=Bacillus thuringiensis TaxID=1428 RepID=UPI000BF8BDFA|nr:hypothetical protein [Bacillus thuringiensis]PES54535.1 hypothetical protein CN506_20995 [Bacillus thuringiensis]